MRGTTVDTTSGQKPVESLEAGDRVVTATGGTHPVRWVGRTNVLRSTEDAWRSADLPVRVLANAIAQGIPSRDVVLTRAHRIFIDGFLIPVELLLNGKTVTVEPVAAESYEVFHVELASHEVLLASGLPVESLQVKPTATGGRDAFDNYDDYIAAFGAPVAQIMPACAPVRQYDGRKQEAMAMLRASVYPLLDLRDDVHIIADRLTDRARQIAA